MTAETLKPFITPTSVDNYVATNSSAAASTTRHSRSCYFLAITASVITVILTAALLGIAIWNTMRISNLQTEVQTLNRVIDSMQKRLGLTYLDDLHEFEKEEENNNTLIDDVLPDDDFDDDNENTSGDDDDDAEDEDDDDDDDDDDYEDYEELMNKFRHYQETEDDDEEETENVDSLGDDNLYDDFEKFNDSKKKHHHGERKPRSLTALNAEKDDTKENTHNGHQLVLRPIKNSQTKAIHASENYERRRSPLRVYNSRRRKFPLIKSGDSLISAKTLAGTSNSPMDAKPAAHFHITHKVPYHKHRIQISNHNGDVYIGKASLSNELDVDDYFPVEHGVLTIREPGLYYVYAQICYNNSFAKNGFTIFHGDRELLQCLHNSHANNEALINTCHTSGLIYLRRNEQIHIRDFHTNRLTFLSDKSNRSFFGLLKI